MKFTNSRKTIVGRGRIVMPAKLLLLAWVMLAMMTHATAVIAQGSFSGTVTLDGAGTPLSGVSIQVFDGSGSYVGSARTDGSGVYTVDGLATGSYRAVTFSAYSGGSYLDELWGDMPCARAACDVTSGTPILVTEPSTTSGIDFALLPGGSISGTVTLAGAGTPIGNVEVDIYDSAGSWLADAYTLGTNGTYTAVGLAAGTYYAVTKSINSGGSYIDQIYNGISCPVLSMCTVTSGMAIVVTEPLTTTGIDFALAAAGRIEGTVKDEGGNPVDRVTINIWDSNGSFVRNKGSNSAGMYSIVGLDSGIYYAIANDYTSRNYLSELYKDYPYKRGDDVTLGTPIVVTAPSTSEIDFVLGGGGSIAGTVTQDGGATPIENIRVRVFSESGASLGFTTTDASGNYSVDNLPTGTFFARTEDYTYQGYADELYDDIPCLGGSCGPIITTGSPISVTSPSETPGIDFELSPSALISGSITVSGSGEPISGVEVWVYDDSGSRVAAATSLNGSYGVLGLIGGTYYARTMDKSGNGYANEVYDNLPCLGTCTVTIGKPIEVVDGVPTSDINFELETGGWISGTATEDVTGTPIADVDIIIYSSDGQALAADRTDDGGEYAIGGLPTGSYRAVARPLDDSWVDQLYADRPCLNTSCDPTTGTAIAVSAPSTTVGVDFVLEPAGRIAGMVTEDGTNVPIQNARVEIFNDAASLVGSTITDSNGDFTVSGLATDTYYAKTDTSFLAGDYLDELYDGFDCDPDCDVTTGTGIAVAATQTTVGVDFSLGQGGSISGTVTEDIDGVLPTGIGGFIVRIFDEAGTDVGAALTDVTGAYTVTGLPSGNYHARTYDPSDSDYLDELYDDIPCTPDCDVTTGALIAVSAPAETSGIDFALLFPNADLQISKTDSQDEVAAGDTITYSITVTNNGPFDAIGARVQDNLPVQLSLATWDCLADPGASCAASGSNRISDLVNLPVGTSVTYTLSAVTDPGYGGTIANTASVSAPVSTPDLIQDNNSATDETLSLLGNVIFGDSFEDQ